MRRLGFLIIGLLVVAFFARPSDEDVFWRWFTTNQERVFRFEADKQRVLDEILAKLRAYRDGLVFEISIEKNGVREFIISADGLKELLPSVTKLVSAAPTLQNWKFVAFRPRLDDYAQFSVEYAGQNYDPKEIWFFHRIEDNSFDVIFYHPNFDQKNRDEIIASTYLMLDMALGEYDVVTGLRYIDHQAMPKNPKAEGLRPFSDLRMVFDEFKKKKAQAMH
jgi:hypothetical protein